MPYRKIVIALGVLLSLIIACGSEDPVSPFQPEIANIPNNFQFQATGVTNVTTTVNYDWQNTGTTANVNQSCAITGGSATLTIIDANAVQVYNGNLADDGTFTTTAGTAGTWTIRVTLTNLTGTLNFRAQKP